MEVSRSRFSLTWGMFLSSCIHGLPFALVLALTSLSLSLPERRSETLQLELFGMVTGQQVSGQQEVAPMEEQPQEQAQEEPAPPEPTPEPKSVPRMVAPRPKVSRPLPRPARQQASEGQVQQTIGKRDLEASAMRQYLAQLSRIVRNRLVYPLKAKAKGWTGVARVAFSITEGGGVVAGSESIRQTSGFEELDQAALHAVRNAGHLPAPPHQMEVVVAVDFSKSDL